MYTVDECKEWPRWEMHVIITHTDQIRSICQSHYNCGCGQSWDVKDFHGTCLLVQFIESTCESDFRYVLITGCDTGFGNLIAKKLDQRGCHVFAACLTEKNADALKAECSDRLQTVIMDVTNTESIRSAYEEVKRAIPKDKGIWKRIPHIPLVPF